MVAMATEVLPWQRGEDILKGRKGSESHMKRWSAAAAVMFDAW